MYERVIGPWEFVLAPTVSSKSNLGSTRASRLNVGRVIEFNPIAPTQVLNNLGSQSIPT